MGRGVLDFLERFPVIIRITRWVNDILSDRLGIRIISSRSLVVDISAFWRIPFYQRLFDLIENIQGDIVECGVFEGNTLGVLAILNQQNSIKRHIWGFDSFEGLPAPSQNDLDRPTAIGEKGMFAASESKVWRKIRGFRFDNSEKVTLVKGWFADTLPKYQGQIAFLHIDADLYESTKCALEQLWNKIQIGGLVVFDDYQDDIDWPGARKAVDEFLEPLIMSSKAKLFLDSRSGHYYAIKFQ